MTSSGWNYRSGLAMLAVLVAACTTSALGRRQLMLLPASELDQMGVAAFAEIAKKTPPSKEEDTNRYVTCVANAVTRALTGANADTVWDVRVFQDETPNAFALPGGKIGVNHGILRVAVTQDQLAAVVGHEVIHVTAGHTNERMSAELVKQTGLNALRALTDASNPMHGTVLGLLGVGVQYGIVMPYGRSHESEADLLGLDLMARAGFDPRESVALWRNMAEEGGQQPPEFLSTHPSHRTRIHDLEQRIPSAMKLRERASGRTPRCS